MAVEDDPAYVRRTDIARRSGCPGELVDVAITLADGYAPDAPQSLRDEAAVRCAGYLRDTGAEPGIASRTDSNENSGISNTVTYRAAAVNPLRASGGTALLARYVSRRAV